jgi:hypothetical protein
MELEVLKLKALRVPKDELEKVQGAASVWQEIIDFIENDPSRVDKPAKRVV